MCKWCEKNVPIIPMQSGILVPMICSGCGSTQAPWDYKQLRKAMMAASLTECPECKQNAADGMNFCAFCGRQL